MQGSPETSELDDWQFERVYTNLFSIVVEQGLIEEKWQYDPLDSKYPTIDGILRRERKETVYKRLPEFALLQLKATRFAKGEDPWPELKKAFSKRRDGKANSTEVVNSIAASCPALLIGLSVDINSSRIEAAYIGAPEGYPAERRPEKRIEPQDLLKAIASVLDALRPPRQPVDVMVRPPIFPRPKELVYFDKRHNGTFSVGESGIIFGRNISVNWTIPRAITAISTTTISGSPEILAVPVALPHPPYNAYPLEQRLTRQEWQVPPDLPGTKDLWWVLQIRFNNGEATVKVEAHV